MQRAVPCSPWMSGYFLFGPAGPSTCINPSAVGHNPREDATCRTAYSIFSRALSRACSIYRLGTYCSLFHSRGHQCHCLPMFLANPVDATPPKPEAGSPPALGSRPCARPGEAPPPLEFEMVPCRRCAGAAPTKKTLIPHILPPDWFGTGLDRSGAPPRKSDSTLSPGPQSLSTSLTYTSQLEAYMIMLGCPHLTGFLGTPKLPLPRSSQ
ncbi:hypothetical protein MAPG_03049 [Magnaporthiopsis poae ATCC 64411]|uniref:Uncharacterized protein n=1 Tax=Magnaporthiopsis poae (strain ATCC 64411 / 73-15) TaxID=644358 RepID=A0A0C4DT01_MAGP6|nr:hypothetical protein MAPG_03049 [Magnaporthiopsis poae ATCC 64411]